ncbi:hypothetical protein Ahy_A07g032065 [Arachis hypogaea]|uniref:Uncharacterized protein n=1 Tax=Arachis hypogaea TaxID=3818 RepID=A0A445C5W3_ARAHY|nr:hypothetical protein Ahy_A07g032065 [Arachis hypogaea]
MKRWIIAPILCGSKLSSLLVDQEMAQIPTKEYLSRKVFIISSVVSTITLCCYKNNNTAMAASVSTIGAVKGTLVSLNGSGAVASSVPSSSAFFGSSLKKVTSRIPSSNKVSSGSFKIVAVDEDKNKQTDEDRWRGLAYDISDDQQDITRGKGMVDPLFQAPMDTGTHYAVMSSYEYLSTGLKT